jgi:hypothetical protein
MTLDQLIAQVQQACPGWDITVTMLIPANKPASYRLMASDGLHCSIHLAAATPAVMAAQLNSVMRLKDQPTKP